MRLILITMAVITAISFISCSYSPERDKTYFQDQWCPPSNVGGVGSFRVDFDKQTVIQGIGVKERRWEIVEQKFTRGQVELILETKIGDTDHPGKITLKKKTKTEIYYIDEGGFQAVWSRCQS